LGGTAKIIITLDADDSKHCSNYHVSPCLRRRPHEESNEKSVADDTSLESDCLTIGHSDHKNFMQKPVAAVQFASMIENDFEPTFRHVERKPVPVRAGCSVSCSQWSWRRTSLGSHAATEKTLDRRHGTWPTIAGRIATTFP
jgi:hypothetical protein